MEIKEILKNNNIVSYKITSNNKDVYIFHNERINEIQVKDSPILSRKRHYEDIEFLKEAKLFGEKLREGVKLEQRSNIVKLMHLDNENNLCN